MTNDLLQESDGGRGNELLLILLNIFRTVIHGIILDRLAELGVLQWFHFYLTGQIQKVVLGTAACPTRKVKTLREVIWRFGMRCHQYVDDSWL